MHCAVLHNELTYFMCGNYIGWSTFCPQGIWFCYELYSDIRVLLSNDCIRWTTFYMIAVLFYHHYMIWMWLKWPFTFRAWYHMSKNACITTVSEMFVQPIFSCRAGIYGPMANICYSIANALELRLFCIKPLIYHPKLALLLSVQEWPLALKQLWWDFIARNHIYVWRNLAFIPLLCNTLWRGWLGLKIDIPQLGYHLCS